jgi:hypothetical protein
LPRVKNSPNDRTPIEKIRNISEHPDRRIKPIVYSMASGGFLGIWNHLQWKHLSLIPNEGEGGREDIAAKLLVYADEPEEYNTFITPEPYSALKDWMDFCLFYG